MYSGVSRGVLRVLQHPPVQLNNSSQHRKQIALVALSSQSMSDIGNGHAVHAQIYNSILLIQILETP